ncbi:MAG: hypothetical protein ACK5MU_01075 [Candidatus Saccharimonadales bacterium]
MAVILCVALFFVFASVRALIVMNRSAYRSAGKPEDFSEMKEMDSSKMYDFIRVLESLGLKFD